jgi:branched-chain amino acid transport system ATP-binding protein
MLKIKDIRVRYGKGEVLKGISMEVEQNTMVAVVGSNGAGKTTLLRTISGLKRATSGEIWFQCKRIDNLPPHDIVRLGISHIPEGRRLHLPMTVQENLKLGAYLRKDKAGVMRDLENIYESFPVLKERAKQIAGSLSGGEQQMLAISRALMSRPKLLLMDEPSLGLSPLMVKMLANIINDIKQTGIGIVLVEQNVQMALRLSEKIYLLHIGSIIAQGKSSDMANDSRFGESFLGQ